MDPVTAADTYVRTDSRCISRDGANAVAALGLIEKLPEHVRQASVRCDAGKRFSNGLSADGGVGEGIFSEFEDQHVAAAPPASRVCAPAVTFFRPLGKAALQNGNGKVGSYPKNRNDRRPTIED